MPIYFAQAGDCGPVKIGWSSNVAGRLRTLQSCHYEDLTLFRTIEAPQMSEKFLHSIFRIGRIRGEWYRYHPEMHTVDLARHISAVEDIRAGRISSGLSKAELSRQASIPYGLVTHIDVPHWWNPTAETMERISDVLEGRRQATEAQQ